MSTNFDRRIDENSNKFEFFYSKTFVEWEYSVFSHSLNFAKMYSAMIEVDNVFWP